MSCVPNHFDEVAHTWDSPDKLQRAQDVAAAIAAAIPLSPAMTAMDYGCGTGLVAWELAPRLAHITLTDTSAGMREVVAQRLAERPDIDRFTLSDVDLAVQPAPGSYDLVYSSLVLHHIPDTAGILRAFHEALHPGGWVAVVDLDHDPHNHFHADDFDGHTGFAREALGELAVAAGFVDATFRTATQVVKGDPARTFDLFLMTARRRS